MAQTVVGIFDNSSEAQQALQELRTLGISDDNIDISSARSNTVDATTASTDTSATDRSHRDDNDGIGGFFRSLFGDDDKDDYAGAYSHVARHSDCIVTVHAQTQDEAQRAADILDRNGAVDVDQRATEYGYTRNTYGSGSSYSGDIASDTSTLGSGVGTGAGTGTTGSAYTGTGTSLTDTSYAGTGTGLTDTSYTGTSATSDNNFSDTTSDTTNIPIIEENLQVGKREVETGGARLRSRIVERPVEEHLRLRSEHVRVERRPVDRPATDADFNTFREGDVTLTEHAEVPIVNKEARVVEEVSLNKDVEERDEVIRDTVRSTEVDVENLGTDATTGTTGTGYTTGTDYDNDLDRNRTGRTDLDNDRSTVL
ncbi:YsnF/AvaK domain-containing protein [Sabulibacter ruber]|uniref:YsnF/AvaK domain-containing protein n=1 Tax=Sabulibacter ruber TaxID=2811901 RepID=UPI001A95992A|nr:YsnF/AvaK domain-containing protein [Sabulibacter ruber]